MISLKDSWFYYRDKNKKNSSIYFNIFVLDSAEAEYSSPLLFKFLTLFLLVFIFVLIFLFNIL